MWLRMHLVAALLRSHRSGGTQAEVNRGVASGSSSPPAAAVGPPTAAAGPAAAVPPPDTPPPDTSQLAPYFSQSLTFLEAENMTGNGGWEARHWAQGGNYFASTVNNVFMSRRRRCPGPTARSRRTSWSIRAFLHLHPFVPDNIRYQDPAGTCIPSSGDLGFFHKDVGRFGGAFAEAWITNGLNSIRFSMNQLDEFTGEMSLKPRYENFDNRSVYSSSSE